MERVPLGGLSGLAAMLAVLAEEAHLLPRAGMPKSLKIPVGIFVMQILAGIAALTLYCIAPDSWEERRK